MKRNFTRILSTLVTSVIIASVAFSTPVFAVNEEFDDPDDDMISQNEVYDDLLNETPLDAPNVTGTSYILYDTQSNQVLMGRNIHQALEPAGVTKLMTVLLALENLDPDDTITVTADMYITIPEDYVTLGITEGEEVTVHDMVYAALLQSANDACMALAIKTSGAEIQFVSEMNARAQELGCDPSTCHFTTCYGNGDITNTCSVEDMAKILNECLQHQEFTDYCTTFQHTIPPTNIYGDTRIISNTNRFISTQEYSYPNYTGGLTGYSETVGFTMASAASKNGRTLIGVIFGATSSENRYADMIDLFEYGYSGFQTINIESSEFTPLYNETISQIEGSLLKTDLGIIDSEMEFSDYLTTTSYRVALGSSNLIDLSDLVIDSQADDQNFNIPICKVYSDGKKYVVGNLRLHIGIKDKVIEVNPEKHTVWADLKNVLLTVIGVTALIIILMSALLIYRNKARKRSDEEYRNRSKML
ncbi:MAG: D-alanyl-D-alanine carboxypeptidase [Clostridiales bacterium]|nr:D-alanyl-D-alanine carboxypeptidase [Clostridiales bacterium]